MRRALGRGLSQLIAEEFEGSPQEAPIEAIEPNPLQPRRVFDEAALEELAASIREHGILQPLLVRQKERGQYELIAGERRLRAARMAGLTHVPILARDAGSRDSLELALIENVQREDIGPMERAWAYKRLTEEFDLTQEQVADRVGKARASVANTLRLLRLPDRIQVGLEKGQITEGHAKALLSIDDPRRQEEIYDKIVAQGLNVREIERLAQRPPADDSKAPAAKPERPLDVHWRTLQDSLATHLGSPVKLQRTERGGRVVIEFYSDEDLQRILDVVGFTM